MKKKDLYIFSVHFVLRKNTNQATENLNFLTKNKKKNKNDIHEGNVLNFIFHKVKFFLKLILINWFCYTKNNQ